MFETCTALTHKDGTEGEVPGNTEMVLVCNREAEKTRITRRHHLNSQK